MKKLSAIYYFNQRELPSKLNECSASLPFSVLILGSMQILNYFVLSEHDSCPAA